MKNTAFSYDTSISLTRLAGMGCILLCHLAAWFGMTALTQLFNVGVPVFLLISGFLYGGKQVKPMSFLANRYLRITLPVAVFILFLSVFLLFRAPETAAFQTVPLYMLNLQGLSFLCGWIPYTELCTASGQLWFITALMCCYLCMLLVQKIGRNRSLPSGMRVLLLVSSCAAVMLAGMVRIYLGYLQIFFIGYGCKKYGLRFRTGLWLVSTGAMLLAVGARLLFVHTGMDHAVWYLPFTALQQNLLAFWIFATIRRIYARRTAWIDRIGRSRVLRHADDLSFYVYIVHYMFLNGSLSVSLLPVGRALQCAAFFAATFAAAEALRAVTILLQKGIAIPVRAASGRNRIGDASRS